MIIQVVELGALALAGWILFGVTYTALGWFKWWMAKRHHKRCVSDLVDLSNRMVHELTTILSTTEYTIETVRTVRKLSADDDATPMIKMLEETLKDL